MRTVKIEGEDLKAFRALLAELLRSADARIRAYATRVIGTWARDGHLPEALKLLEAQIADDDALVRLEAIVAASYVNDPRAAIIAKSLNDRGALIHTRSMQEACAISNRIAPEHLEVSSNNPHQWEPLLIHAGAIFLGAFTSESLGDYCAGPNHVLPTSGTARFSSPLGVYDFQKRSSLIEVSEAGAQILGQTASVLAHGEGLQAHARAAEMRLRRS